MLRNFVTLTLNFNVFKVFLKDKLESELEVERNKCLSDVAKVINNRLWSYYLRKKFLKIKKAIVRIQKEYKVSFEYQHFYSCLR